MRVLQCYIDVTDTIDIFALSLHDALPISQVLRQRCDHRRGAGAGAAAEPRRDEHHVGAAQEPRDLVGIDRKSTRLNSSHTVSSYAVFCLKKKKNTSAIRARRCCYALITSS